ncbi:sensor histidine kinase [soil metagenome]
MKKGTKILLHVGFWFYKFVWGTLMGGLIFNKKLESLSYYFHPLVISELVLYPIIFYFNYFFIMPKFYKTGKTGKAWIAWVLLLLAFIAMRYGVEEILYKHWLGITNYSSDTTIVYYMYDNLYFGGPLIVMSILFWILDDNLKSQKERYALLDERRTAQLSFLKNQVNPHFIFNTLNNIYSLVSSNSEKSLPAIEKLSQLMRYMYKDAEGDLVMLTDELDYITSYLDLQRIRLSAPAILQYSVSENIGLQKIAPLILIPFIENMFKHGLINNVEKPLSINIELDKNKLRMETVNYINKADKDQSSGVGLKNVRNRLDLLYAGNYDLKETIGQDQYSIILQLNLDAV